MESCNRVWFYIWMYTEKYMLRCDVTSQFTCEQKQAWYVSVHVTDKNLRSPSMRPNLSTVTFDHKNKHISHPWVNMLFLRTTWCFEFSKNTQLFCGWRSWECVVRWNGKKAEWTLGWGFLSEVKWDNTEQSGKKGLHSFTPTSGSTARDFPRHLHCAYTSLLPLAFYEITNTAHLAV